MERSAPASVGPTLAAMIMVKAFGPISDGKEVIGEPLPSKDLMAMVCFSAVFEHEPRWARASRGRT